MDGTLGYFWMELGDVYDLNKSHDGHVRLVDGALFHIDALRTLEHNRRVGTYQDRLSLPESVYAMTPSTCAIFFDIADVSQSNVIGPRAPTRAVRTRGVVVNVLMAVLTDSVA